MEIKRNYYSLLRHWGSTIHNTIIR